jgi:hypothetical protein
MKHWLMAMCFSILTVDAALAQQEQAAPLPPNAAAEAPELEVAMKFSPKGLNDIENSTRQNSTSGGVKKEVTEAAANPPLADNNLPPTLTVRTAALLELHAMRKNAVSICLQLPSKYRKHLPQCADIFKHEIRLEALARDKQ